MDAGLFVYIPRDPGQNIYFLFLKNASPPPSESTVRPLTKKKKNSFNHSPIVPIAIHIAMPHGL